MAEEASKREITKVIRPPEPVLETRGWLTWEERTYLYNEALRLKPGSVILEVGGEYGASTASLRYGAPKATIITVDLFPSNLIMQHRFELAKLGIENTLQFRGDSRIIARLWRYPLDFLFIDGGHTYEVASSDANLLTPWVRPGRRVAFHDYHGNHELHAQVRQAIDEWHEKHDDEFSHVMDVESIIVFERLNEKSRE